VTLTLDRPGPPPTRLRPRAYRVGVDLDGVLVDWSGAVADQHEREFAWRPDITTWDFAASTALGDMGALMGWVRDRDLFRLAGPYPGAVAAALGLREDGHAVALLTARPAWAHDATAEWLERHGLGEMPLHLGPAKTLVDRDAYVDDHGPTLAALRAAWPWARVFRRVQPWNRPLPGVEDVGSLDGVRHRLREEQA